MEGLDIARAFARQPLYSFSPREEELLAQFFTNASGRVFFMQMLPANIGAALIAMYSRLKNPRGIRGMFVDKFLPELLASLLPQTENDFGGKPEKLLAAYGVKSVLDMQRVPGGAEALNDFWEGIVVDPDYLSTLTQAERVQRFLRTWLDAYGHNSIARGAAVWLCFEQISILAAKSIEWGRPGAGYIELSTRYVDMSGKDTYPIHEILSHYGIAPAITKGIAAECFSRYREWQGDHFDGPFPAFLRERYGALYTDDPASLEQGVIGETCDVLGNFLPASTLTSVGACVSGEALPSLVMHLLLDGTPENVVLAELIREEAARCGADQFLRHEEPSPWKRMTWEYLDANAFASRSTGVDGVDSGILAASVAWSDDVERSLLEKFSLKASFDACVNFSSILEHLAATERRDHDKLPNEFETVSADFEGVMSFRGWRDLHRMGFSTHFRTRLTPLIGFYHYDKPAPDALNVDFRKLHSTAASFYDRMCACGVPEELREYVMPLGTLIGFTIGANLAQHEFCIWQRTKPSVNHEVRRVFLAIEQELRYAYLWWRALSRTDRTPAYVFARGKKAIPLT